MEKPTPSIDGSGVDGVVDGTTRWYVVHLKGIR
jgi:hypothetical protein